MYFGLRAPDKIQQWTLADAKEFDELGTVLADMKKTLEEPQRDTAALNEAVSASSSKQKRPRAHKLRRKKKKATREGPKKELKLFRELFWKLFRERPPRSDRA